MWRFVIIFFLLPFRCISQAIIPVASADFSDAMVLPPDTFDIASVLTYNSDPDFLLEFGFNSLMVQQIAWESARIKVEVYRMNTPEGAFGAYSL